MDSTLPSRHRPASPRTLLARIVRDRDATGLDDWCAQVASHRYAESLMRKALYHTLLVGWDAAATDLLARQPQARLRTVWWRLLNASAHLPPTSSFRQALDRRVPVDLAMGWVMQRSDARLDQVRALVARGASPWQTAHQVVRWVLLADPKNPKRTNRPWTCRNAPGFQQFPQALHIRPGDPLHAWLHQPPPSLGCAIEGVQSAVLGSPDLGLWRICLETFPGHPQLLTEAQSRWVLYALPKLLGDKKDSPRERAEDASWRTMLAVLVEAGVDLDQPARHSAGRPFRQFLQEQMDRLCSR